MTARCHKDSCSIKWSEVVDGGRVFQADLAMGTSLACDGDGVDVKLSAAAGNILSLLGDGLYAGLPVSAVDQLSSNPTNNPVLQSASFGSPASSDDYAWTNTLGRDALALVSGELNFNYGILGPSHAFSYTAGNGEKAGRLADAAYDGTGVGAPTNKLSPYNAELAMHVLADVGVPAATGRKTARADIGGMIVVSSASGAEQKTVRIPFFFMIRVAAGATLNLKSQAWYEGPSQTVNVLANPAGGSGLAGTGHELWNLQVAGIPI